MPADFPGDSPCSKAKKRRRTSMSALLECSLGKLPNLILGNGFCWCPCEQTEGRLWFGSAELNSSKKACTGSLRMAMVITKPRYSRDPWHLTGSCPDLCSPTWGRQTCLSSFFFSVQNPSSMPYAPPGKVQLSF